jgi:hypothetical protein
MFRLTVPMLGFVAVSLAGCAQQGPNYGPKHKLSDDEIAAYAVKVRQTLSKHRMDDEVLGVHNGTRVVAEFPFLDDGQSQLAVVHYDVDPGEACTRMGGVVRLEWVPAALAATQRPFCVPKVLVDRNIQMGPLK